MRKHPLPALIYVLACDLIAVMLFYFSVIKVPSFSADRWVHFGIWTVILCIARLGYIEILGLKVMSGWSAAIEVAASLILPFPLFCLSVLVSFITIIIDRLRKKHPEPFLGPDFNASNLLFGAAFSNLVRGGVYNLLDGFPFGHTVALLVSALAFSSLQIVLLNTLLAIDLKKPWTKAPGLDSDVIVIEGMMVSVGALAGQIYLFDPYLVILTSFPLIFLQKTFEKINQAKLAFIDGKTQLYNYRYLDGRLNEEFRKSVQSSRPMALVFGDMDHLRDVNNTYGHMVGDYALIAVAKAFREVEIPEAVAARFGGEEFVLLIPGYDTNHGAEVAERIRRSVEKSEIPLEGGEILRVTISMGVASYPQDAAAVEELIKAADAAVYEAKNTGRNRVCVYSTELKYKHPAPE